ncbi:MAG: hypothetical protein ABEJ78_01030 [Haloferacaceae archaeon]
MSDSRTTDDSTTDDARADDSTTDTQWKRLATADPLALRDPLAELLGMVEEGDPLVFSFTEVAKAAGHACPAVAGAYRATQLALDELYPERYPVRSEIRVTVDGDPSDPGLGPMASVVTHVTGADSETGFAGFGGYGGRANLLDFGDVDGPDEGRTVEFERTDTGATVRVTFSPAATGTAPPGGDDDAANLVPRLVAGEATREERRRFYDVWHGRVERILAAKPGDGGPFSLERPSG